MHKYNIMNLENIHSIFIAHDHTQSQIYANANNYHSVIFELKHNFINNIYKFIESGEKSDFELLEYIKQEINELTEDLPTF